jgi:hypothetical protein
MVALGPGGKQRLEWLFLWRRRPGTLGWVVTRKLPGGMAAGSCGRTAGLGEQIGGDAQIDIALRVLREAPGEQRGLRI